jgi:transcriptional regulator with XRE-family HTH domain
MTQTEMTQTEMTQTEMTQTEMAEEIKVLRQIIEGLKRNNMHLNYDVEKTREWAIVADKEIDLLKTENSMLKANAAVLNDSVTVLKDSVARLTKELAESNAENASMHEIINGL